MPTVQLQPLVRYLRLTADAQALAAPTDAQLLARFVTERDEAAFTALVRRHGPLVLALCRRVLRDNHTAEDAFQATFLLLARKADSLAEPELLGNWLYGVAYRTAAKARSQEARRRVCEGRVPPAVVAAPDDGPLWRDLRPVLDEEINRLPARYRVPVVLCYLEGWTNAEAARKLECSRGTVATRLARAREQLRRRLTARGLDLPAALTPALLTASAQASEVSAVLAPRTVDAVAFMAGGTNATAISTQAVALAKGVAMDLFKKQAKLVGALFLTALLTAGTIGLIAHRVVAEQPTPTKAVPPPPIVSEAPTTVAPPPLAPPHEAPVTIRTANFEVTAPGKEVAKKIADAAELHRKALAEVWLGKELPRWTQPCPVRVRLCATGGSSASSFNFEGGKVTIHGMNLEGPLEEVLQDQIPHEVTHTVLAHWYGQPVPRWADEGAAVLEESAAARSRNEASLRTILKENRRLPLRLLLPMREYPQDVMALYAQGYAVTDFLVRKGGRAKFLAFVKQGESEGWKKAAKDHYGFGTVEELETAWLAGVKKAERGAGQEFRLERPLSPTRPIQEAAAAVGKDRGVVSALERLPLGRLPVGPAPIQVLVALDSKEQVTVWRSQTVYRPQSSVDKEGNPITSYVLDNVAQEQSYALDKVKFHNTKGKVLTEKEVRKFLKGETPALVAAKGCPIDPLHLRLVKEDTLIVVLPQPTPPPAPGVPPTVGEGPPPPQAPGQAEQ